jgi:hypothetical protein
MRELSDDELMAWQKAKRLRSLVRAERERRRIEAERQAISAMSVDELLAWWPSAEKMTKVQASRIMAALEMELSDSPRIRALRQCLVNLKLTVEAQRGR